MSTPAAFDAIALTLADAQGRFGTTAFADRRRIIGLLADHVPEAKREIRAIGTAIDEGVPAALGGSERHLIGMEMDRLAERLEASTGLRIDIAKPVVRAFAFALGLGPLPSVYVGSQPVAPPPAPGWAGMSEPVAPTTPPAPVLPIHGTPTPVSPDSFTIAGKTFPKTQVYLASAGLVLMAGAMQFLGGGSDQPAPTPAFTPTPVATTANVPQVTTDTTRTAPVAENNYADETTDFGVPAQATLQDNVGSATPLQIPVGQRITTGALRQLLAREPRTVLVDVLDGPHEKTIDGARFLPGAGNGGTLNDSYQTLLVTGLKAVAGGEVNRPIVFFCMGSQCWESYNAVLRANAAGYRQLLWYRGGLASWATARLPMTATPTPTVRAPGQ